MTFQESLQYGEEAEVLVFNLLRNWHSPRKKVAGMIAAIFDVRSNPKAQKQDYDFTYVTWDEIGSHVRLDVKHDSIIGTTNNFFIEHKAHMKKGNGIKDGWMHYSIADDIYYVDEQREIIFIFSLNDMREYIKNNDVRTRFCYDEHKRIEGYLVNIDKFAKQYNLRIFNYDFEEWDYAEAAALVNFK